MSSTKFEALATWVVPRLPKRFQEGRLPYLFLIVWLLIGAMVVLAVITPYPNGVPVPLAFACVLLILQLLFIWGLPLKWAVNLGLLAGLLQVCYAAWMSGGIFSPRMAWLAAIPLIPFYAISRFTGMAWLVLVLCVELAMAYITWHGWLPDNPTLGAAQIMSSFASYTVVTLIVITVPFLYDSLFRQAYAASLQRNLELEEKRKELLRTAALREQFIATVSHELRTPMNAILGLADLIHHDKSLSIEVRAKIEDIQKSGEHLLTIINDLLDHSQMEAGRLQVVKEPFNLTETIHSSFQLLKRRAETKPLHYRLTVDSSVPSWVMGDGHRLTQILVNLLGNAIKFTDRGEIELRCTAEITTSADPAMALIHLEVRDTGMGIPADRQHRVFQNFSQVDHTIARRFGGNGLGLSITHGLVQAMGGEIHFTSQVGQGTHFFVDLPCALTQAPAPMQATDELTDSDQAIRILIADDNPLNRQIASLQLRRHLPQAVVTEVANGLQAFEQVRDGSFDVILMDLLMPEMDGLEASRKIRTELPEPQRSTPIIALTANTDREELARCIEYGMNECMLKPFNRTHLVQRVLSYVV